jgi:glucose/mannose-6-phosphate isomerase
MDIETIVRKLPEQFSFQPAILRAEKLFPVRGAVVGGMGGSHLPAGILKAALPDFPLTVHHDYGIPLIPKEDGTLYVAVSFSGNTEETLDFAKTCLAKGLPLAAISSGGELAKLAEENQLPFILVPKGPEGFQPRMAVGYLLVALLSILGKEKERSAVAKAAAALAGQAIPASVEKEGKDIGVFVADGIPLIYSSRPNAGLAYYLKALLNETPKLAAFINQFPEINHNEMLGVLKSREFGEFRFLFLRDAADRPRVAKRMQVFSELVAEAGGAFRDTALAADPFDKIVRFIMLANWAAVEASARRKVDPFDIGLVEDFKKRMVQ